MNAYEMGYTLTMAKQAAGFPGVKARRASAQKPKPKPAPGTPTPAQATTSVTPPNKPPAAGNGAGGTGGGGNGGGGGGGTPTAGGAPAGGPGGQHPGIIHGVAAKLTDWLSAGNQALMGGQPFKHPTRAGEVALGLGLGVPAASYMFGDDDREAEDLALMRQGVVPPNMIGRY